MESWGPWFLWALFAAILVWEEVWDLPNTAYLSAWLLLIITAGMAFPCVSLQALRERGRTQKHLLGSAKPSWIVVHVIP